MIRGRKEGGSYSSWFIGFDHEDSFGFTPFPELPTVTPKTPVVSKPIARATSLETLVNSTPEPSASLLSKQDLVTSLLPRPLSVTPVSTQTQAHEVVPRAQTPDAYGAKPRSQDADLPRSRKKKGKDTHGLYREALEGAKRSEEFKFRIKFDQLLGDLHLAIEEKTPNGLSSSFALPSYGEVMLTFRDKVKDILKGFSQRLVLAYDSFGSLDNPDQVTLHVKQDISRFIEDLIGESLDLTSDEAVSDLSSLSDDSTVDQHSFEDVIAQAVVSKLLENHRKEVSGNYIGERNRSSSAYHLNKYQRSETADTVGAVDSDGSIYSNQRSDSLRRYTSAPALRSTGVGDDSIDAVDSRLRKGKFSRHRRRRDSVESLFSNRSELIPDLYDSDEEEDEDDASEASTSTNEYKHSKGNDSRRRKRYSNGERSSRNSSKSLDNVSNNNNNNRDNTNRSHHSLSNSDDVINKEHAIGKHENQEAAGLRDENENDRVLQDEDNDNNEDNDVADVVKDFEELKEFVRKTQASARPARVEVKLLDECDEIEIQEEQISKTIVDHVEKSEDFHSRFSVLDRVLNSEPPLPDFSQFENIDFNSHEIDPDLLSMNLAIIPEETEEELEQEEEEEEDEDGIPGRWRANWIFKGKGVSPYQNVGKKKMSMESDQPVYMTVPAPGENWAPWRDADVLSDNSDSDLLNTSDIDKSDDDESSFYANTSRELARISGSRRRGQGQQQRSSSQSHDELQEDSDDEEGFESHLHTKDLNSLDAEDHLELEDIPGPIIEPAKQELKLLTDLVPADNDDPKFIISPESVVIQEGEPVRFSCQVTGTPPVDVFWYREGEEVEELEDSEDVELFNNGDKHSATLYNIGKKMAGQYMCIALSDAGKAIQYLVVTVKDNKQELKKPEFLKGLADVEVTEGQSVKFRAKVKGIPPPRISWYKDGALLRNSKACRIGKFGNRDYILTIDYATMDDDAEYTVSARNVAGETKSSAQVIVEPPSELPTKRQRLPSLSNTASTDSESERVPKSLETALAAVAAASASSTPTPTPAARKRQEKQQITQLDRKMTTTQKRVEEEANKMQQDAEKVKKERMLTPSMIDILHTAEETLQQEKDAFSPQIPTPLESSLNQTRNSAHADTYDDVNSQQQSHIANGPSRSSSPSAKNDEILGGFELPDTLDDFPMPGLQPKTKTPTKSTLSFSIQGGNQQDTRFDDNVTVPKRRAEKYTSEVSVNHFVGFSPRISPRLPMTEQSLESKMLLPDSTPVVAGGDQDISFDSGKDVSISLASSVSSDASLKEFGDDNMADAMKQHSLRKGVYSRDFEVPKTAETKKWSVTLDPFSPKADVVNRQSKSNEKSTSLEISFTDLSPSSSQLFSKGDNSSQSSPRQSVDSGIYVHRPKERPAPVHMVGDTSENDVPESRTEFNVEDGAIELPSVNRLRAMFSSGQQSSNSNSRDDLGDGSFKRRSYTDDITDVHSITARSVSKTQLEQLRAMNQMSPTSPSPSTLQVPGGVASKSSATLQLAPSPSPSSSSISLSSSSSLSLSSLSSSSAPSSKLTVKTLFQQPSASPRHEQVSTGRPFNAGAYEVLDSSREPVLIYPETNPSSPSQQQQQNRKQKEHRDHNGQVVNANRTSKPNHRTSEPSSTQAVSSSYTATSLSSQSVKTPPQRAQPRLIVRRASEADEIVESGRGTPRIKSGCISARAAFWERKIVDGNDLDTEEFPDMVEDTES